jgi:hypothetical protein
VNKKYLVFVMALLVLVIVAPVMVPVMAAPAVKTPYTAVVSLTITDPGEVWTTRGGIQHVKGVFAEGSFDSAILPESGIMQKEFDFTVNVNTGKGTIHGKFVLTVGAIGTLEGSFRGIITGGIYLAGTVVGCGTGGFEGLKTMGIWEGEIDGAQIENVLEAILLSPKG